MKNLKDLKPFNITDLLDKKKLPFHIYLALSDSKAVLLGKKGDQVHRERLERYLEKQVEYVYVPTDELNDYEARTQNIAQRLLDDPRIPDGAKISVLAKLTERIFGELTQAGFKNDVLHYAHQVVTNSVKMIERNLDLSTLLKNLKMIDDPLMAHSMAVGSVSVMIARAQGWLQTANFEKVAMGGLLHDVGIKMLPPELQNKPVSQMAPTQLEIYHRHPALGLEALKKLNRLPKEILSIVHEHHEHEGKGYPRGLKNTEIHPLAQLVSLADHFCYMVLPNINNPQPISPKVAVHTLLMNNQTAFKKEDVRALAKAMDTPSAA